MMKLHLNLITLALVTMSGTAMANYGLANANTAKVNTDKWECKRCVNNEGARGSVAVSGGFVSSDDNHASNAFNGFDDGAAYGFDADLDYRRAGHEASLDAYDLGSDHGVARLSAGKSGVAVVEAEYAHFSSYTAEGQSQYVVVNNQAFNSGEMVSQDIKLDRERYGAGLIANIGMVETFANFQREEKTGSQIASLGTGSAINFIAPVDTTTDRYEAGARLQGANWFTGVSYIYSDFSNNQGTSLFLESPANTLAYAPSNDAYQLMFNGAYQFGRSHFAGRVVSGQMNQSSDLVSSSVVSAFDGEVDTLDVNLDFTTLLTNKLRLKAGVDYSDRDNKSTIIGGQDFVVDPVTGTLEEATLVDTTTSRANLGASYRIASGYRISGDYQFEQKQSTAEGWDEEETQDHAVDVKLKITAFDLWDIAVKGGYSHRDMSKMDADRLLAGEHQDNALLRRYNLADRDRTFAELNLVHTPTAALAIDFNAFWALDDYSNTEIGLTEGEDYGYDLGLSYVIGKARLHAFGGQQWINSNQQGNSSGTGNANWSYDVEDSFVHVGFGASYQLKANIEVGADYQYSDSNSDTIVINGGPVSAYDDYFATSHNITVYGDYAINDKMGLRLEYQFEGFEETDYNNVAPGDVNGLVPVTNLDHDYDAHLVMLSFSYKL